MILRQRAAIQLQRLFLHRKSIVQSSEIDVLNRKIVHSLACAASKYRTPQ
jgi:hypothetical protein